MTPEERAKLIVDIATTKSSLIALIGDAIRIAVEEEREACAKLCDQDCFARGFSAAQLGRSWVFGCSTWSG